MENLRKVNYQDLETLIDSYTGKQVQINISPIKSSNTYPSFRLRNLGDMLEIYNIQIDRPSDHELTIPKEDIKEILFYEGNSIYESVFQIILINGQVDISISEKPVICHRCSAILDKYYTPIWEINQTGSYGSQWDGEHLKVNLCENCLVEFLGTDDYHDDDSYKYHKEGNVYYLQ